MEKLRGELWERRAVDGKLKSSLEWPNGKHKGIVLIYLLYLVVHVFITIN